MNHIFMFEKSILWSVTMKFCDDVTKQNRYVRRFIPYLESNKWWNTHKISASLINKSNLYILYDHAWWCDGNGKKKPYAPWYIFLSVVLQRLMIIWWYDIPYKQYYKFCSIPRYNTQRRYSCIYNNTVFSAKSRTTM